MSSIKILGLIIVITSLLAPLYWLQAYLGKHDDLALFSQYIGIAALISMSWGQMIATRFKVIEGLFGGLDRGYILHKWLGIFAIISILLHDTIDADMRGLGVETLLTDMAETFGEISLYGLLILVVISIATFIPYHLWRWTHKFMGLFFMFGAFHYLFILKPFNNFDPVGIYVTVFCAAGIFAFIYRLLPSGLRPAYAYGVESIAREGGKTCLEMRAEHKPMRHRAGQFAFIQFPDHVSKEPHPFTISNGPNEAGKLRVTIADLGDFTGRDLLRLEKKDQVKIEGPFGHFTRKDRKDEIWIAAGIGVTPFAAWLDEMSDEQLRNGITFYFCVKDKANVPHLSEIEAYAKAHKNFKFVLCVSTSGDRLTADRIAHDHGQNLSAKDVYFCGPSQMREDLKNGLRRYGVLPRQFHYEEFEIRSGIGLKKLAKYALERLLPSQEG